MINYTVHYIGRSHDLSLSQFITLLCYSPLHGYPSGVPYGGSSYQPYHQGYMQQPPPPPEQVFISHVHIM